MNVEDAFEDDFNSIIQQSKSHVYLENPNHCVNLETFCVN